MILTFADIKNGLPCSPFFIFPYLQYPMILEANFG